MVLGMIYIFFGPSYADAQGGDTTQLLLALIGLVFTNEVNSYEYKVKYSWTLEN